MQLSSLDFNIKHDKNLNENGLKKKEMLNDIVNNTLNEIENSNDSYSWLVDQVENKKPTFDRKLKPKILKTDKFESQPNCLHIVTKSTSKESSSCSLNEPNEVINSTIGTIEENINVNIPGNTVQLFLKYAKEDYSNNIETLGILAGNFVI